MTKKTRVARLSILSNSLLILMKIGTGLVTGSVSILSEAIHSFLDLLAAIIAFFSVKISDQPPDPKHPYGHGKFENLSGVVEGVLILIAAGWIIFEAVKKLVHPAQIESFSLGLVVMLLSGLVNLFISRILFKTAKETDSIALKADALHLSADVYTSFGVALGLLLIWLTGWLILDPIVAILVALFILKEAWGLIITAYRPLVDVNLDAAELELIQSIIQQNLGHHLKYHQLRTRKSGSYRYIDFHLEVPAHYTVEQSHDIQLLMMKEIRREYPKSEISIHIDPVKA